MKRLVRIARKVLERAGIRNPPFFIRDNPDFAHLEAGEFSYGKPLIMGWDGTAETRVTIGIVEERNVARNGELFIHYFGPDRKLYKVLPASAS